MKPIINFTIIFIVIGLVTTAGIVGGIVLSIYDKDATAFYGFFGVTLTSIVGFGGTLYGLNKVATETKAVKANVNGNLSRLIELAAGQARSRTELAEVRDIAERAGVTDATGEILTIGDNA